MATTLTMHDLIQHFEDRLRQMDRRNLGDGIGKEPQFPQLIVYLGRDARNAHMEVSSHLLQLWPQYRDELKFLCVEKGNVYSELPAESDEEIMLTEDGVKESVSALFGTKMHFSDRSKLLVYYILDTTGMPNLEEFCSWMPIIESVRRLLCPDSTMLLDMLFLLLNENLVRKNTAEEIRNYLSDFYNGNQVRKAVSNVLLLSNRRSDNAILEDWGIAYRIISATIALSNNSDAQVATGVFCNSILTASYAREEKPIAQIGHIVVDGLLEALAENVPNVDLNLMDDLKLEERLGLTKNGTIKLLDAYVDSNLSMLLPSEEQLELFPRREPGSQMRAAAMSAEAFNEYTMGSWNQYLKEIVHTAKERVERNSAVRQDWGNEYRKYLADMFSKEDICYLVDHIDDVKKIMHKTQLVSGDTEVLLGAKNQLKYLLSSDESLIRIFVDALLHQGQIVADFTLAWNSLLSSRRDEFAVRDANMLAFYERKVRQFIDRRGVNIFEEFSAIHETEALVDFLKNTIEDIIDSDEVFSAAFEDELESRLNNDAPTDAKQYIRRKLTGNEVFTYLQTSFSLGTPLVSAILLKIGTPLHKNLDINLAPTTVYYNTGSSSAAEALVIYEVSKENLVSGGRS